MFILNAAEDSYVSHFTEDAQWWKYLYDVPVSCFDNGFILLEKTRCGEDQPQHSIISKDSLGVFICSYDTGWNGRVNLSDEKIYVYCPASGKRRELLGTSSSTRLVENAPSSDYSRSFSYNEYKKSIEENTVSRPYLFFAHDSLGRLTSFSYDGFSRDELIKSNRSNRPSNPWKVSYDNDGHVAELSRASISIKNVWSGDTLRYKRILNYGTTPHYDLFAIIVSNPNEEGRWTQGTIYDYDVIDNGYIPVLTIKRSFLDKSDDIFERANYDVNRVEDIKNDAYYRELASENTDEAIPITLIEEKPGFMGGDPNAFSMWVNSHLVYPEIAKENGVQGKVTVQFTIETDGTVSNVKVLRGVDPSLDKEAVRVVSQSPKWTPGKLRDKPVKVTYTFPVIFQLVDRARKKK